MRTLPKSSTGLLLPTLVLCTVPTTTTMACGDPQPRFTEPVSLGGQTVSPQTLERGARIYSLYCVACHAADGSGRANGSRSFSTPPRDFREADFRYVSGPEGSLPTDEDLMRTVSEGQPANGMPAWDGLDEEDRRAVIQYIKTFSTRWTTEVPPADKQAES